MYCGDKISLEEYARNEGVCDDCALTFGSIAEDF